MVHRGLRVLGELSPALNYGGWHPGPRLRPDRLRRAGPGTERLMAPAPKNRPALITSANPTGILSTLAATAVQQEVEAAAESNCLLRCARQRHSLRLQLRNRPTCNLPPHAFSCTRAVHSERPGQSRAM